MPVIWGVRICFNLTRAAWIGGAVVDDPLIANGLQVLGCPPPVVSFEDAALLAPLDFRYPWRRARSFWSPGSRGPNGMDDLLLSHEQVTEAVRRAPSYAPPRYHLCGSAFSLGQDELADESALAALRLAPLHLDLRRKVADYFRFRFEDSGSDAHLNALLRSMGRDRGEVVSAILARLTLTFDEMQSAFGRAGLEQPEMIAALEEAGRWDWAIRMAASGEGGGRTEGGVLIRYAHHLLERGAVSSAYKQASRSRELAGEGFSDWLVFGEAAVRVNKTALGLDALGRALDGASAGTPEVAGVLVAADVSAEARAAFWSTRLQPGVEAPDVELELIRALVDGGRLILARDRLAPMLERPGNVAEAHYLLARVFLASENRAMALRHAQKADELSPDDSRYRDLVRRLSKRPR